MKQCYELKNFRAATLVEIAMLEGIIEEYQADGFVLTVRQLYYQCVARGHIENTLQEYKRIAATIDAAKKAGLLDWDAIEDRTREVVTRNRWSSGGSLLHASADQYHMDMWAGQDARVFAVVEKEALVGVLERACFELDVPLLAARGYPSGSIVRTWVDDDLVDAAASGQRVIVLHLGDHDPSGIDMTRDLVDRIAMFAEHYADDITLTRIALTMPQIDEQQPPENPAKTTDSRFSAYRKRYGDSSWELDALSPQYLDELLREHAEAHIDRGLWDERQRQIEDVRRRLKKVAREFDIAQGGN